MERHWNQFEIRKITGSLGTLVVLLFSSVAHAQYFNMGAMWQGPKLVFSVTPSSTGSAGAALALQPSVALTNPKGTVITNMSKAITLAAFTDVRCTTPAGGSLSATTNPVSTSSGVSAFAGVGYSAAATIYLKASAQGVRSACWGPIAVSTGGGNPTPWNPEPSRLSLSGPAEINTTICTAYDVTMVNYLFEPAKAAGNVSVTLSGAGSGAFYADSGCANTITSATVASGTYRTTVYYKGPSAQTNILTATDAAGTYSAGTLSVTLFARRLTLTGVQSMLTGTCQGTAYQINYLNSDGTQAGTSASVSIDGYQAGSGGSSSFIYDASGCGAGAKISGTGPVTVSGTGAYSFWYKSSTVVGELTFRVTATGAMPATLKVAVVSALPTKLVLFGSTSPVVNNCQAYSVASQNASSVNSAVANDTTVTLSQTGTAQIYSDSDCSVTASSVSIPAGTSQSATFYLKSTTAQSVTLTASVVSGLTQATMALTFGSGITPVVSSYDHSCMVLADRTVKCWGTNTDGQLGNGTTVHGHAPVTVQGISSAVSVDVGGYNGQGHSCALLSDQTVKCWGKGQYGRLGDGNQTDSSVPVTAVVSGVTAIGLGDWHTCALLSDQTVKCWGFGLNGEIGNGTGSTSVNPATVTGLTGVVEIAVGSSHACALLSNQTVKCWGNNTYGELGDGTTTDAWTPVAVVGLSGVASIRVGSGFSCAILTNQSIQCWGYNSYGQFGNGTTTNSITPVSGPVLSGLVELEIGGYSACALLSDQSMKCWGYNGGGQLGIGSKLPSSVPVTVPGFAAAVSFSVGWQATCAAFANHSVKCAGAHSAIGVGVKYSVTPTVTAYFPSGVAVSNSSGTTAMSAARNFACMLMSDKTVKCWGFNGSGQLGNGTTTESVGPTSVSSLGTVDAISVGESHACALLADQTVKCWGSNGGGRLGDGTTTSSSVPVSVASLSGVTEIAAGGFHTCALLSDKTVKCWGENAKGQLGDGTIVSSATPVLVSSLTNVAGITAGNQHTCVRLVDQTVKCWGFNLNGQLGNGGSTDSSVPVNTISLTGVTAIASRVNHTCAVLSDQTVKCWGYNYIGQLGFVTGQQFSATPGLVTSLSNVTQVSTGSDHSCARLADQSVRCWGSNDYGAYGNGTLASTVGVSAYSLSGATSVSCGEYYSCAVMQDQSVKCWGYASRVGFDTSVPQNVLYLPGS